MQRRRRNRLQSLPKSGGRAAIETERGEESVIQHIRSASIPTGTDVSMAMRCIRWRRISIRTVLLRSRRDRERGREKDRSEWNGVVNQREDDRRGNRFDGMWLFIEIPSPDERVEREEYDGQEYVLPVDDEPVEQRSELRPRDETVSDYVRVQ